MTWRKTLVNREPEEDGEPLPFGTFLKLYISILASVVLISALAERLFGVDALRVGGALFGVMFLLAAGGRPRLLYKVVRSTGWFALIDPDWLMRVVLVFAAAVGFALAFG
jgi:hypothetical protein